MVGDRLTGGKEGSEGIEEDTGSDVKFSRSICSAVKFVMNIFFIKAQIKNFFNLKIMGFLNKIKKHDVVWEFYGGLQAGGVEQGTESEQGCAGEFLRMERDRG